jgi:ankyrin repeat protein
MFDELLEKGADPSIKNDAEYLPVHSAILNGYEKMFDALIKHSDSIDTDLLLDLEFHISTEFVQKVLYFDFNIKYSHDLVRMKKLVAYMLQCNNNNLLWFLFYSDVYEAKIFAYVAQYLGVNITKCMK